MNDDHPASKLFAAIAKVIASPEHAACTHADVLAATLYLSGIAAQQCGTTWEKLRKPFEAAMKDAPDYQAPNPDQGVN